MQDFVQHNSCNGQGIRISHPALPGLYQASSGYLMLFALDRTHYVA